MSTNESTLELTDLEQMLDGTPGCEAKHQAHWPDGRVEFLPTPCTVVAEYHYSDCETKHLLVCEAFRVDADSDLEQARTVYCGRCFKEATDCSRFVVL